MVLSDPLVASLHLTTACNARTREAMGMHIPNNHIGIILADCLLMPATCHDDADC